MTMKKMPSEEEVRRYFHNIYRSPDDMDMIYPEIEDEEWEDDRPEEVQ